MPRWIYRHGVSSMLKGKNLTTQVPNVYKHIAWLEVQVMVTKNNTLNVTLKRYLICFEYDIHISKNLAGVVRKS